MQIILLTIICLFLFIALLTLPFYLLCKFVVRRNIETLKTIRTEIFEQRKDLTAKFFAEFVPLKKQVDSLSVDFSEISVKLKPESAADDLPNVWNDADKLEILSRKIADGEYTGAAIDGFPDDPLGQLRAIKEQQLKLQEKNEEQI